MADPNDVAVGRLEASGYDNLSKEDKDRINRIKRETSSRGNRVNQLLDGKGSWGLLGR